MAKWIFNGQRTPTMANLPTLDQKLRWSTSLETVAVVKETKGIWGN